MERDTEVLEYLLEFNPVVLGDFRTVGDLVRALSNAATDAASRDMKPLAAAIKTLHARSVKLIQQQGGVEDFPPLYASVLTILLHLMFNQRVQAVGSVYPHLNNLFSDYADYVDRCQWYPGYEESSVRRDSGNQDLHDYWDTTAQYTMKWKTRPSLNTYREY